VLPIILSLQDKEDSTFFVSNWQLGNVVQIEAAAPALRGFVLTNSNFSIRLEQSSEQFTLVGGLVNPNVGINPGGPGGNPPPASSRFSRSISLIASSLIETPILSWKRPMSSRTRRPRLGLCKPPMPLVDSGR